MADSTLVKELTKWGLIGGALWLAWKHVAPTASKAADALSTGIAKTWVGLTNWYYGSVDTIPTGNVILPNGAKIPLSQVHVTWDASAGVASFVYNGYGYIIRPNPDGGAGYDQNGDYHAE
jgi:hypothetical protein